MKKKIEEKQNRNIINKEKEPNTKFIMSNNEKIKTSQKEENKYYDKYKIKETPLKLSQIDSNQKHQKEKNIIEENDTKSKSLRQWNFGIKEEKSRFNKFKL